MNYLQKIALVVFLCSLLPVSVALYVGYGYLEAQSQLLSAGAKSKSSDAETSGGRAKESRALLISYFWSAVVVLSIAGIAAIFQLWFIARELSLQFNQLRKKLRKALFFSLPNLRLDGDLQEDPVEKFLEDFHYLKEKLEYYKQNEVFREQVSRWQEIARRLAHEIRNPLTPILLAAQELKQKYPGGDDNYRELLETSTQIIEEEVEALRRLVEEFSAFAKLPSPQPKTIELNTAVREFLDRYGWFREKVKITWEPEGKEIYLQLDKMLFFQALKNLIQNAIEAGSSKVIIRTGLLPTREAICQIEDFGKGIPPKLQTKIFTPYFTTKKWGTGLGLAITKKIIMEHNGEITVAPNPKGGSIFTIRFRIRGEEEDPPNPERI